MVDNTTEGAEEVAVDAAGTEGEAIGAGTATVAEDGEKEEDGAGADEEGAGSVCKGPANAASQSSGQRQHSRESRAASSAVTSKG